MSGTSGIYAKTLSFFDASRACSIDFGQFVPMFRSTRPGIEARYLE
jgi:hypothetical protein